MNENESKTGRLGRWARLSRLESLLSSLGLFCFFMALLCVPLALYNNPVASQSLFNPVKFQPMFRYVFLGFVISGLILVTISGHILLRRNEILSGDAVSLEDRVRIASERDRVG